VSVRDGAALCVAVAAAVAVAVCGRTAVGEAWGVAVNVAAAVAVGVEERSLLSLPHPKISRPATHIPTAAP
jgi:hypothetical protein